MKNIPMPVNKPLEYYLKQEELLTDSCTQTSFFTWIVDPTVIYGKNQRKEVEINLDFCLKNNIRIVQRKSGGGCVYADNGNIMISLIAPTIHHQQVFSSFINSLAEILTNIGYPAVKTEHNDILVNDYKVSGSACYLHNQKTIVHSTMLYNTDFDMLQNALTPTKEKLEKHSVPSVRQRVTNLVSIKNLGNTNDFKTILEKKLEQCNLIL